MTGVPDKYIEVLVVLSPNMHGLHTSEIVQWLLITCSYFCLFASYKGPLLEDGALTQAASGGASSPEYTKLCAWLVSELRLFCKLEENVQATNSE